MSAGFRPELPLPVDDSTFYIIKRYLIHETKNIDLATWISQHCGAAVLNEDRYSDGIITSDYESGNPQNSVRGELHPERNQALMIRKADGIEYASKCVAV